MKAALQVLLVLLTMTTAGLAAVAYLRKEILALFGFGGLTALLIKCLMKLAEK